MCIRDRQSFITSIVSYLHISLQCNSKPTTILISNFLDKFCGPIEEGETIQVLQFLFETLHTLQTIFFEHAFRVKCSECLARALLTTFCRPTLHRVLLGLDCTSKEYSSWQFWTVEPGKLHPQLTRPCFGTSRTPMNTNCDFLN